MQERADRDKQIYKELLDGGVIITEDESRELISKGYKTALILFEKRGIFLVPLNRQSIEDFFKNISTYSEFEGYSIEKTHFLGYDKLLDDTVFFASMLEERKLLNMREALTFIDKASFLERTTAHIAKRIKLGEAHKLIKRLPSNR